MGGLAEGKDDGRPKVAIVATGGTIANTAASRVSIGRVLDSSQYRDPLRDPHGIAALHVVEPFVQGADEFAPHHWMAIARAVTEALGDAEAAVVTHGTVSIEETAYFLNLVSRTEKPIVLTCAQRRHESLGSDGPRNLYDAVRTAVALRGQSAGVVIVASDLVHAARGFAKRSQRPGGFASGSPGVLGTIEADQISMYRRSTRRHTVESQWDLPTDDALPRVDVIPTYPGADGVAIRAAVAAGARGLVVVGYTPNGAPAPEQLRDLEQSASEGVAVVLAGRGGDGRVPRRDDFITADDLTPWQARVLTMVAIANGANVSQLQAAFDTY